MFYFVCTHNSQKSIELYQLYLEPHVSINGSKHYRNLMENAVASCAESIQEHADFQNIYHKLNLLRINIFEKCCAAVERNDNDINVLTHGDLWSNNIMFKCDQNENVETLPIFVC